MVQCPVCHQAPEMASLFAIAYLHFCEVSGKLFYTNGNVWSTAPLEGRKVLRTRHPDRPRRRYPRKR